MNEENKDEFLQLFVKRYFTTSDERKTLSNQVERIAMIINHICDRFFEGKVGYTSAEIIEAFSICGFSLMDNSNIQFNWEGFQSASVFISDNDFLNIKVEEIRDLDSARMERNNKTWNAETIERVTNLRSDLGVFWFLHKGLI